MNMLGKLYNFFVFTLDRIIPMWFIRCGRKRCHFIMLIDTYYPELGYNRCVLGDGHTPFDVGLPISRESQKHLWEKDMSLKISEVK